MATYKPISELRARDFDETLHEDDGVLSIILTDDQDGGITCTFDAPLAYRKLDEGAALLILAEINMSGGLGSLLYVVEGSEFSDWFRKQSQGTRRENYQHYCLATINSVIDVLANDPPSFSEV